MMENYFCVMCADGLWDGNLYILGIEWDNIYFNEWCSRKAKNHADNDDLNLFLQATHHYFHITYLYISWYHFSINHIAVGLKFTHHKSLEIWTFLMFWWHDLQWMKESEESYHYANLLTYGYGLLVIDCVFLCSLRLFSLQPPQERGLK